jgi:hypothetical protein
LIVKDIGKVLYAPRKVFAQIIQNPKYLGAIIVLLLFVATQTAFYYLYYSKNFSEQTFPVGNQFGIWTQNATLWNTNSSAVISYNYGDLINSTFYGNSSLQFALSNSSDIFVELGNFQNSVNCDPTGFQNMSMRIKIVEPQIAPEKATLSLYSLNASNYFQYDLTQDLSNSAVSVWNNLTVPVGSGNWLSNGNPNWQNITGLRLDLTFSTNSSISLRIQGVFFRGIYKTPIEVDSTRFFITILQLTFTQFLFEWLILTALLYIMIKGLKGTVTWKPLFAAVGFALITIVIQTLIAIAATTTLPSINYPIEFLANVPVEAQLINNTISATVATFSLIFGVFQIATYLWIVTLGAIITRTITAPTGEGSSAVPQFGWGKSFLVSGASLLLTIIIVDFIISMVWLSGT